MPTREYAELWYPEFGVEAYHRAGIYGAGVSIYIIDTGLAGAVTGLSNVHARTVVNSMTPLKAQHGSFVASIVAAPRVPGATPGVAPEAQIYLADVSGPNNGTIYTSYLVKAILDAIELRVDIISISLGTSVYDQSLENAVKRAESLGILVFAASGNCSCRTYEFPSACDAAISVASMDRDRVPSVFNTRNDSVAIFAPGQNISVPGSKQRLSGTSFAVPFASGLAALELSKRRLSDKGARMDRGSMIAHLRTLLGLSCETHSYSNDVCAGRFAGGSFTPTEVSDGARVITAMFFGLLLASLIFFILQRRAS
jgi:subtilisin family serine protease